jgi:hypothetical protein
MYVENNGVRHNCHELLAEFQADAAKDGCIDLHLEGDMCSFLSVRYLNKTETGEITADQEAYIDTLLAKYNMTECNPNKVPLKTSVNLDEIAARLPCTPHPEVVSLYAQLIGELMFIAINTQPLIDQPVNALARFMTTANSELYVLAKGVLRYLKGIESRKIVWCASRVKIAFRALRDLCLFRCKLGRHCPTTQEFSQLSDFLQQCGVQLEILSFLFPCHVICRS